MVYNTNYKDEHWDVIGGLNLQQFRGKPLGIPCFISPTRMPREVFGSNGQYKVL